MLKCILSIGVRQIFKGDRILFTLNQIVVVAINFNFDEVIGEPDCQKENEHDEGVHKDHEDWQLFSCVFSFEIIWDLTISLVDSCVANILVWTQNHDVS